MDAIPFKDVEEHLSRVFGAEVTIKAVKLPGETRLREGQELEQMRNEYGCTEQL